jgi:hypothetical protein
MTEQSVHNVHTFSDREPEESGEATFTGSRRRRSGHHIYRQRLPMGGAGGPQRLRIKPTIISRVTTGENGQGNTQESASTSIQRTEITASFGTLVGTAGAAVYSSRRPIPPPTESPSPSPPPAPTLIGRAAPESFIRHEFKAGGEMTGQSVHNVYTFNAGRKRRGHLYRLATTVERASYSSAAAFNRRCWRTAAPPNQAYDNFPGYDARKPSRRRSGKRAHLHPKN